MRKLSLTALVAATFLHATTAAPTCFANLRKEDFSDCAVLGKVALHWSTNSTIIRFGVDAEVASNTGNWVGVGLSDYGGMRGSDLWILLKNDNGSYRLQDSYSKDFELPSTDASQDVQLLTAPQPSDTNTVYTFQRAIITCDSDDYPVIKGREHSLVWAIGSSKTLSQHSPTNRGDGKAVLWKDESAAAPTSTSADEQFFEITMKNVTIPSDGTSYMCTHFSMPADEKYHAVRYQGVAKNKYVHHMIVYSCTSPPVPPAAEGDFYPCARMESACSELTYTWAPGAGPFSYPAEAGVPFGKDSQRYFSLQVHYNNPDGDSGVIDSSGFQIFYTTKLRQYEVGVLTLGNVEIRLPGNNSSPVLLTPNACPGTCTSRIPSNLTLISVADHMHTLGLNMTIQRVREGKELAPLHVRRFYDFNYQGITTLNDPDLKRFIPGDTLITTCAYRPTEGLRTNVTTFGEASQQEMCFAFVQYYPKTTVVETCLTVSQLSRSICSQRSRLLAAGFDTASIAERNQTKLQAAFVNLTASGDIIPAGSLAFDKFVAQCVPSARLAGAGTSTGGTTTTAGVTTTGQRSAGRRVTFGWAEAGAAVVAALGALVF
ncbi:hypothetical protein HDU96_008962 [Phlyctochytrium bullatum]|nr:hypothetical protein HDU96_008962 [Phlyctochytrium bullatum]